MLAFLCSPLCGSHTRFKQDDVDVQTRMASYMKAYINNRTPGVRVEAMATVASVAKFVYKIIGLI